MSEKQQILEQLDEINSSLFDNQKFAPYNYNVLVLWGFVSGLLFLTFDIIASYDILYSIGYLGGIIFVTMMIEKYYIKQENIKYDLEKFTTTQKFIESLYVFVTIISLFFTYLFFMYDLVFYIYLVWMVMIAFANYVVGFVLNNRYFTVVGLITMSVVFSVFTISFIFSPEMLSEYIKYIAVIFSSFGCILIGLKSKNEY